MRCVREFDGPPRKYDPTEPCDPYEKFKAHMQWVDDKERNEWDELGTLAEELWCSPPKWSRWWNSAVRQPCRVCFACAVFVLCVFAVWLIVKVYS